MNLEAKRIMIAGVPRSGSTWAFNAARLVLESQPLVTLHSAWIDDYEDNASANTHLIKLHREDQLTFTPDIIITTFRDTIACLASLIRMGWLEMEPSAIRRAYTFHQRLYAYWDARKSCEVQYNDIISSPERALIGIE